MLKQGHQGCSHCNRLLELAFLLYAIHEVTSVDKFHNEI